MAQKVFAGQIEAQLKRINNAYNADHDLGPDAPVTWREHALMVAVGLLLQKVENLEAKVSELETVQNNANMWIERQVSR